MIKFFRRIRQRLLADGKVKNYALYAIGEIALIVIGILLAFQINNWNETQKTRRTEAKIIVNLIDEFIRNHNELVRVSMYRTKVEFQ